MFHKYTNLLTGDSLRTTIGLLLRFTMRRVVGWHHRNRTGRGRSTFVRIAPYEGSLSDSQKSAAVVKKSGHTYPGAGGFRHRVFGERSRAQTLRQRIKGSSFINDDRIESGEYTKRTEGRDQSPEDRRKSSEATRSDHEAWKIEDRSEGQAGENVYGRSGCVGHAVRGRDR